MKYIRRIGWLLIAFIFIASVFIGLGVIFSVRNVNVTLLGYDEDTATQKIQSVKQSVNDKFGGKVILFAKEEEIGACVDGNFYTVESIEKAYPCTINLTVKERRAVYASVHGEAFDIYDENGVFLKKSETFMNEDGDGAPFVKLLGFESDKERAELIALCNAFKEEFSALRSIVSEAEIKKAQSSFGADSVTFSLRCGMTIEVKNFRDSGKEKLHEANKCFSSLKGEQKLTGRIYCNKEGGEPFATYDENA